MANILKGIEVAKALNAQTALICQSLKEKNIIPTLAILRVGNNDSDVSYQKSAVKKCQSVGIEVKEIVLSDDVEYDYFYEVLDEINNDKSIHGILMLRPLPDYLDNEKARKLLNPAKDVDGCTDLSLAGVFTDSSIGFCPCTAQAALEILKYYNIPLAGKNVVIIGRSLVIGKPVSMLLLKENATVTICHSKTADLKSISKKADIIIAAIGKMEMLDDSYFSDSQTVIDVGIHFNEEKQKLCGDVLFDKVEPVVANISPVPGGVGSVTTSVLLKHVVEAANRII